MITTASAAASAAMRVGAGSSLPWRRRINFRASARLSSASLVQQDPHLAGMATPPERSVLGFRWCVTDRRRSADASCVTSTRHYLGLPFSRRISRRDSLVAQLGSPRASLTALVACRLRKCAWRIRSRYRSTERRVHYGGKTRLNRCCLSAQERKRQGKRQCSLRVLAPCSTRIGRMLPISPERPASFGGWLEGVFGSSLSRHLVWRLRLRAGARARSVLRTSAGARLADPAVR